MTDKMLGIRIYYERIKQGLTLRQLARKTGVSFSNINRIEKGLVNPKKESLDTILKVLKIHYRNNVLAEKVMHHTLQDLYQKILYVDYDKAKILAGNILKQESNYLASPLFIDYLIVMLIYAQHTQDKKVSKTLFYKACEDLEPFMNEWQKEHFFMEKGLHLYFNDDRQGAYEHFTKDINKISDKQIVAMCYYVMGAIFTEDYRRYNEALYYLDLSKEIFEQYANYKRSNRAKAIKQTVYIYTHRFTQFIKLAEETFNYAKTYDVKDLYAYTQLNMARYHIIREEYAEAIDYLESVKFSDPSFMFLKVYSYFVSQRHMEALHLINDKFEQNKRQYSPIHQYSIEAIHNALLHNDSDVAINKMRQAVEEAFSQSNYLMIQLLVKQFVSMLEARRKYKEALSVSEKLYKVMRKIN